jgi:putative PIN family toxin of toxin-antitoxin system
MLPAECVTRARAAAAKPSVMNLNALPRLTEGDPRRVVLDTNTVLEWLVFRDAPACGLGAAITCGRLHWLASPRMLAELRAVLSRPLAPRWDDAREHALTIEVSQWVVVCAEPTIVSHPLVCRDPDDQVFIDLAREHRPAVLLTRDRALLALRRRAAAFGVVIATATSWWQQAPGNSASTTTAT